MKLTHFQNGYQILEEKQINLTLRHSDVMYRVYGFYERAFVTNEFNELRSVPGHYQTLEATGQNAHTDDLRAKMEVTWRKAD